MSYVATIGFFDGVHSGHRFVLHSLHEEAQTRGLQSAVITFSQHPQTVLTGTAVPLLTTPDERVSLLREMGVDEIFAFNFPVIRDLTAKEFLHILHSRCDVSCLLMGYDHRFGSDGLSSFEEYAALGNEENVEIVHLSPLTTSQHSGITKPSSSAIRKALLRGDIESANTMLGYAYTITGEVVHGKGFGHTLGFPTANIAVPPDKLIPAAGVYAAQVTLYDSPSGADSTSAYPSHNHAAICNIGTNPTVGGTATTVEIHIPYFTGDLYGETLSLQLKRFIRAEQRFPGTEQLKKQIEQDIQELKN